MRKGQKIEIVYVDLERFNPKNYDEATDIYFSRMFGKIEKTSKKAIWVNGKCIAKSILIATDNKAAFIAPMWAWN